MSAVISLRVDDKLYHQLDNLSKKSGVDKAKFLKDALIEYMEDKEDYFLALAALQDLRTGKDQIISWEDLKKDLGL